MNKSIVRGSITDVVQKTGKSVSEIIMDAEILVLFDSSSSMLYRDAREGRSRFSAASDDLRKIQGDNPGKVFLVCFSDSVTPCIDGNPVDPYGGTGLTDALNYCKMTNDSDFKLVVISDGSPNSSEMALRAARMLTCKIHTIHIGSKSDKSGIEFMKKLANVGGGSSSKSEIAGDLMSGMTLLLTG